MINNRQAGRRNRGRNNNNGRPNGNNRGGGDNGNRIDSRARGNATQLLEKYRNMARDAQMAGDRVNAEYYLQFADHYFRVLADNRARQEEQQPRPRMRDDNFDSDGDDFDGGFDGGDDFRSETQPQYDRAPRDQQRDQGQYDRAPREQGQREQGQREQGQYDRAPRDRSDRQEEGREPRDNREPREFREPRENREPRGNYEPRDGRNNNNRRDRPRRDRFVADGDAPQQELGVEGPSGNPATEAPRARPQHRAKAEAQPEAQSDAAPQASHAQAPDAAEAEAPRPRRGRPRKVVAADTGSDANEGLDLAVLPPSIGRADNDAETADEAPKKRTRRPRTATEAAE